MKKILQAFAKVKDDISALRLARLIQIGKELENMRDQLAKLDILSVEMRNMIQDLEAEKATIKKNEERNSEE